MLSRYATTDYIIDDDDKYCWQVCCSTEMCGECKRLNNGTVDFFDDTFDVDNFKLNVDDSTKIDIEIMTENPNMYVNLKELVERFIEIDEYYNHEPWNLQQIIANINICGAEEFK